MTIKALEQAAIDAHRRHERFTDFWAQHGSEARRVARNDLGRFARLYHRLLMLTISGDTAGEHALSNDDEPAPWEADDAAARPHDTETQAFFQGFENELRPTT